MLINDKEVVMTAASNGISWALQFVSDELKSDKDILELIKASN